MKNTQMRRFDGVARALGAMALVLVVLMSVAQKAYAQSRI